MPLHLPPLESSLLSRSAIDAGGEVREVSGHSPALCKALQRGTPCVFTTACFQSSGGRRLRRPQWTRTDYVSLGLRTLKNHQQHKKLWKQQLTDNEQPLEDAVDEDTEKFEKVPFKVPSAPHALPPVSAPGTPPELPRPVSCEQLTEDAMRDLDSVLGYRRRKHGLGRTVSRGTASTASAGSSDSVGSQPRSKELRGCLRKSRTGSGSAISGEVARHVSWSTPEKLVIDVPCNKDENRPAGFPLCLEDNGAWRHCAAESYFPSEIDILSLALVKA